MRLLASAAVFALLWFVPTTASAQGPSHSVTGFGGLTLTDMSSPRPDLGASFATHLTPHIQLLGEFGRVDNMLPPLATDLLSFTPYDLRISAFYAEGGVRLLASPGRGITPYAEATAGIARLRAGVSGLDSRADAIADAALGFFQRTEPVVGVGGGVLWRGGALVVDLGYRYKQIAGNDGLTSLLAVGDTLRAHQIRVGMGVRF